MSTRSTLRSRLSRHMALATPRSPAPVRLPRGRRWWWWIVAGFLLVVVLVFGRHVQFKLELLIQENRDHESRIRSLVELQRTSTDSLQADRELHLSRLTSWAVSVAHDARLARKLVLEGESFADRRGLDVTELRRLGDSLPRPTEIPGDTQVQVLTARTSPGATYVDLAIRLASGEFAPGLTRADFEVRQGQRRVHALSATPISRPGEPWNVALLLDKSGSTAGEPLRAAQEAARQLVVSMANPSRIRVWTFAAEPEALTPWTYDTDVLGAAIAGVQSGGATSLLKALQVVASDVGQMTGRRAIVVFSDGKESATTNQLDSVLADCGAVEASVHAVLLDSQETDEPLLKTIAERTQGSFHRASEPTAIRKQFDQLSRSWLQPAYRLVWLEPSAGPVTVQVGTLPPIHVVLETPN